MVSQLIDIRGDVANGKTEGGQLRFQVSGDGYLAFQSSQRQLFNKRRDLLGSSNTGKGTILGLREGEIDSCGTGLIGLPVGLLIGFPGVGHGHTLGV